MCASGRTSESVIVSNCKFKICLRKFIICVQVIIYYQNAVVFYYFLYVYNFFEYKGTTITGSGTLIIESNLVQKSMHMHDTGSLLHLLLRNQGIMFT